MFILYVPSTYLVERRYQDSEPAFGSLFSTEIIHILISVGTLF